MKIPKILHQTWKSFDDIAKKSKQSFTSLHPEWEYRFWSDEDCERLIKSSYPHFYNYWINLNSNIKKWDATRYVILHAFGGLYADIDFTFHKNLDQILDLNKRLIFRTPVLFKRQNPRDPKTNNFRDNPFSRIKNHFILSEAGNLMWETHLHHIITVSQRHPNLNVFDHVANNAVATSLQQCLRQGKIKLSEILFLKHRHVANKNFLYENHIPNFNKAELYAEHLVQGSWLKKHD